MIFGWLENGRTDRWVLVDALFPWPALHNGREAIRLWADHQQRLRVQSRSAGPRRCPWPCKTAVKEDGHAELRIWPCGIYAVPRSWSVGDRVWRGSLIELAEHVAADIGCPAALEWMGGSAIERAISPPGLAGRGFICWGKGQHEPNRRTMPETLTTEAFMKASIKDLGVMPQGENAWL